MYMRVYVKNVTLELKIRGENESTFVFVIVRGVVFAFYSHKLVIRKKVRFLNCSIESPYSKMA